MESVRLFSEAVQNRTCNVRGIGILEAMNRGVVDRPAGTGDWMLVYFHDSVCIGTNTGVARYPADSLIIWTDTTGHYYGNPDNKWTHSWIHVQGVSILPIILSSGITSNKVLKLSSSDIFCKSLKLIYLELIEHVNPDPVILQNLFQNMLIRLIRQMGQGQINRIIPQRIVNIKSIIETYSSKKHTVSSLAEESSMSIPNFCAEFKKYVGIPPIGYLIKVRMQRARFLLYEHNLSITEIADRVGYNDIFHFSKQFKKYFGVSPGKMQTAVVSRRRQH